MMKLSMLKPGQSARILEVGGEGALRQHFLDMGVIPGAVVTLIKLAPMGDPMELRIHGYELTLRVADAGQIEVSPGEEAAANQTEDGGEQRNYRRQTAGSGGTGSIPAWARKEGSTRRAAATRCRRARS